MKITFKVILILIGVAGIVFSIDSLFRRHKWEQDNCVEFCVDSEELYKLTNNKPGFLSKLLTRFHQMGVSSVSVYWDGTISLSQLIKKSSVFMEHGFLLTLRPALTPFTDTSISSETDNPGITNILFAGSCVSGFPDQSLTEKWMHLTKWKLPWIEFSRQHGLKHLIQTFPDRVVRGHSLNETEMSVQTPAYVLARYRRAARERGIRFFYIRFFPGLSIEQNLHFAKTMTQVFSSDGFVLGSAKTRYSPSRPFRPEPSCVVQDLSVFVRQGLALLSACVLPVVFFRVMVHRLPSLWSPVCLTGLNVFTALFIASLLSRPDFMLGINTFRGVKIALALPLVLAFCQMYGLSEIRSFLKKPVTFGLLLAWGGMGIVFLVYLFRSGHNGFIAVSGWEHGLRDLLESFFGVRPRFKEFLIGHPFLWLGFYLMFDQWKRKQSASDAFCIRDFGHLRIFLVIGFIGQLSMINTFCHAHTPLAVSIERTFHGFCLGTLIGGILILFTRLGQKYGFIQLREKHA